MELRAVRRRPQAAAGRPTPVAALAVARRDDRRPPAAADAHDDSGGAQACAPGVTSAPIPASDAGTLLRLQVALLGGHDLEPSAAAFATELAASLAADRVSVGMLRQGQVDLVAMSHDAGVHQRGELARAVCAAMEEAIHQGDTVSYPGGPADRPRIVLAHAELARYGGAAVSTVPLISAGRPVGALTLERRPAPLSKADLAFCEHLACLVGPVLELKRRAEQGWPSRAIDWLRGRPRGSTWALAAGVLAAVGLAWVPVPYRVGAPARVEGAVQRVVSAPADGFLKAIHVRPGDEVGSGALLVELADRELTLEQRKWESALTQHENSSGAALARGDRAEFAIGRARAAEAQAELDLVQQRLARTLLTAPFDGVVIKGDLSQALGAPVERGEALMTIAPRDRFRVIVEVDERDIGAVQAGQRGRLALAASPVESLPITVARVTPVAAVRDGRNVFDVEAALPDGAGALRPGLQGVAKIEAGTRSLGWVWTHRIVDWLRLTLWSWGG